MAGELEMKRFVDNTVRPMVKQFQDVQKDVQDIKKKLGIMEKILTRLEQLGNEPVKRGKLKG